MTPFSGRDNIFTLKNAYCSIDIMNTIKIQYSETATINRSRDNNNNNKVFRAHL